MRKPSIGVIIFGAIEICTLLAIPLTLIHIEYFPMVMLFLPMPVAILGILTIKLKPLARRLNLLLSPIIVFTYSCTFMIIFDYILSTFNLQTLLKQKYFTIYFVITLIIHILFFTHNKVKAQFQIA